MVKYKIPMLDSCWGLTENNKFCKAIILQLKNKLIKKNLLKDDTEEKLHDLGYGDNFLDATLNAWSMKEIIDNAGSLKL